MDNETLLSVIQNNLSQSMPIDRNSSELAYYLGNPRGDEVEGRSQVVSTDVADAIEWMMPQIMRAFTQNNEVVVFDPLGPEDEEQAEIESSYVYDVIMKENNGFIILYEMVKDALIYKNGILKVFFEKSLDTRTYSFTGLTPEQIQATVSDPNVSVIGYTQDELTGLADIKLVVNTPRPRIYIECVPYEEFRVNNDHNSLSLENARFTAHTTFKTRSELIEAGYEREFVADLPAANVPYLTDGRFRQQNESPLWNVEDESVELIEISECYMKIDLDDDGIAELNKITVCGHESPTEILSIESLDYSPWVATTGILMPHKFRGLSIYDRLKQVQDQKTTLWRNILDNIYFQNNSRTLVVESQVNLDDLTVSRPGGIVRTKRIDAVAPLQTPQLASEAFGMLEYLDAVRAGRTGVAPEGEATPQRIGDRVGSQGVDRLLTAKEELVGLIVRLIAETAIKPLCLKVRDLCIMHMDAIQDYKFRGKWIPVNPSQWPNRSRASVRVGTGSGNRASQIQTLTQILQYQAQIYQAPGQSLVTPDKVYAALNDFAKYGELLGASKYFLDPSSPEGQQFLQSQLQTQQAQQQKQDQIQQQIMEAQVGLAQAELQKAQAQQDNVQLRAQIDQLKAELSGAKEAAAAAGKDADRTLKKFELETKTALELTKLEIESKMQQDMAYRQNLATADKDESKSGSGNSIESGDTEGEIGE